MTDRPGSHLINGVPRDLVQQYGREAVLDLYAILRIADYDKRFAALELYLCDGPRPIRHARLCAVIVHLASNPNPPAAPAPRDPRPPTTPGACALPIPRVTEAA